MIPRRRVPISMVDVLEWFRALVRRADASAEDVRRFEQAFAEYLGCAFARATSSGRDAIVLALEAVGTQPGDEVIVPAYTLGELMPTLQACEWQPVPADVEAETFNLDPQAVAGRITPKTRAILATHLLGAPCNIEAICALARDRGLAVVEDCAHALGAEVGGRKVGTFGDAAIFSLEVNKAAPTYGGGMFVTNDPKVAESVSTVLDARPAAEWPAMKKALSSWIEEGLVRSPLYAVLARILFSETFAKTFEQAYRGSHDRLRGAKKTRYTGFQARLGLRRLAQLDDRNERLNRRWDELAERLPDGLGTQVRDRAGRPAFYNFVTLTQLDPRAFRRRAMRFGVDVGITSEVMDDCGRMLGAEGCPVATRIHGQAILLPLYDGLSNRRFRRLIKVLGKIAAEKGKR